MGTDEDRHVDTLWPVEVLESVGRIAVSSIPVIGSPLAQAHAELVMDRMRSRWEAFMVDVAVKLKDVSPEALAGNEQFVTVVARASMSAARTHVQETRLALLNAVENTVRADVEDDVLHMFISLIESLTPSHIQVLRFLAGRAGNVSRSQLLVDLDAAHPELALRGVRDRMLVDLRIADLIDSDVQPFLSSSVLTFEGDVIKAERLTTKLGEEFLAFIGF